MSSSDPTVGHMSIDVGAPRFLEDPYAGKSSRICKSWRAWLFGSVGVVLIILNSYLLRAFNTMRHEYEALSSRFSNIRVRKSAHISITDRGFYPYSSHKKTYRDPALQQWCFEGTVCHRTHCVIFYDTTWEAFLSSVVDDRLNQDPDYRWPLTPENLIHYECLYPVAGGTIHVTGGFPQSRLHDPEQCKGVLDWYFTPGGGQYWKDLEQVRDSALEYLTGKETFKKGDSSNIVIFDIDETVLSNLEYFQARSYVPAPANETGLHDQELHSPALDAIKEVYLQAYNYGMSTAFITGRNEGSRDHTEKNLKRVGFGEKCPVDKEGTIIRTQDKPCYIGLHLRDLKKDMNKLASVYKPERRKELLDAGFTLVATFGDQFSDSDGLYPALAAFKTPNPLYYIL